MTSKTYKVIRKNAYKMIAKIEKGFLSGRSYNHGNWTDIQSISNILEDLNTYNGAYLAYRYEEQKYTLHIHSNYFASFKSTYEP